MLGERPRGRPPDRELHTRAGRRGRERSSRGCSDVAKADGPNPSRFDEDLLLHLSDVGVLVAVEVRHPRQEPLVETPVELTTHRLVAVEALVLIPPVVAPAVDVATPASVVEQRGRGLV